MKTKRFLSLLLSLALVGSLAAPALAVEVTPEEPVLGEYEFRAQYLSEHPELFDADAYFAEQYSDWWPKEEYMSDLWLESEEEFQENMRVEFLDYGYYSYPDIYEEFDRAYDAYVMEYYEAAHPGELEGLFTDDLLALLGYDETLTPVERFMKDWGVDSEDQVRPTLLASYVRDRLRMESIHADFLVYLESYPEEWETFDADAYFAQEYTWYDDKEEYMGYQSLLTEEEFAEVMFVYYVEDNYWDWDDGWDDWWSYNSGEPTLVVNGQTRYEATLTAADGVSYLPAGELNELLGTDFAGDGPVAIREAAQAAGWDVTWNRRNNEVILLGRERLLHGIVIDDTVINEEGQEEYVGVREYDFSQFEELLRRILTAAENEKGQSYRTTGTYDFKLTAFNSLDGDKSYDLTLKTETLIRDNVIDLTLTADVAQLLELLGRNTMDALAREMPKVTFQNLKTLLTGCKVQLLLDLEAGELYWNTPLLAIVDSTAGEDTWYHLSLPGWELGQVTEYLEAFKAGEVGIGDALYAWLLDSSANSYMGAWSSYSDFMEAYGYLNLFFGPHTMTEENGTLTWSLDAGTVNGMMGSILNSYRWSYDDEPAEVNLFKEYDVSISIDKDGKVTSWAAARPDMDAIAAMATDSPWYDPAEIAIATWALNLFDFRETAHSSGTADHAEGMVEFHWKNQFKLEVETVTDRKEVREAPRSAPPKGAEVVEL